MGVVEGQRLLSSNDWEEVKKGGDKAIKEWINGQMNNKSCAVVLIGYGTAGRKWINYEIEKAWNDGKGVVGVHIHNLKDLSANQSPKGANPFASVVVSAGGMSSLVKAYDPPYSTSNYVYDHIETHLPDWVEEAIEIREKYAM